MPKYLFKKGDLVFIKHEELGPHNHLKNIPLMIRDFDDSHMDNTTVAALMLPDSKKHVISRYLSRIIKVNEAPPEYFKNMDNEDLLEHFGRSFEEDMHG